MGLLQKVGGDDPIDAFAVHGACGAWGVLAAALFDWGEGFQYANGWNGFSCYTDEDGACLKGAGGHLIGNNIVEVLVIIAWVGGLTALVMLPLRIGGLLRASDDIQEAGMDESKHSPSKAYVISGMGDAS